MPIYPADLPTLIISQNRLALKDPSFNMVTQRGRTRRRIRSTSRTWMASGILRLTPDQVNVFEDFYRYDIGNGIGWFEADWFSSLGLTGGGFRIQIIGIQRLSYGWRSEYSLDLNVKSVDEIPAVPVAWPLSTTSITPPTPPVETLTGNLFFATRTFRPELFGNRRGFVTPTAGTHGRESYSFNADLQVTPIVRLGMQVPGPVAGSHGRERYSSDADLSAIYARIIIQALFRTS